MTKTWHLLHTVSASMPWQMAFDETLFLLAQEDRKPRSSELNSTTQSLRVPLFRFYFSSEPWMSVGYSDPLFRKDSKDVLKKDPASGLPVCRRLTGGGKVIHGEDLMFSIILQKEADESFRSVRISYWKIHEALKVGLESLDVQPQFYRCDQNLPRGGECFKFPIASDLSLNGKKFAGGAQKRSAGVMLHEESIQWKQIGKHSVEEVTAAILAGFEKVYQMEFTKCPIDPEFLRLVDRLEQQKINGEAKVHQTSQVAQSHESSTTFSTASLVVGY